jgi:hypothetical protein
MIKSNNDYRQFIKYMRLFLIFCKKELNLKTLPKIVWVANNNLNNGDQPSFGGFNTKNKQITIEILNRHPMDIFRTISHELCHYKQYLNNKINSKSGETGSKEENEANATAGVIMRKFGKKYPNLYKFKPIIDYNE